MQFLFFNKNWHIRHVTSKTTHTYLSDIRQFRNKRNSVYPPSSAFSSKKNISPTTLPTLKKPHTFHSGKPGTGIGPARYDLGVPVPAN